MKKRCQLGLSFSLVVLLSLAVCGSSLAELMPSQPGFPNAQLLVSADSLQNSMGEDDLVIIDARSSGYDTGHIPGAINIKHGDYWTWGKGLLPVAELNSKLSAAGLKRGMTFVIYDDTSASWGAAGRIFWMLEYLGCPNVHILDGGWDKWVADERATENTISTRAANTFEADVEDSRIAAKKQIKNKLYTDDFVVIDSRTDEEFIGWQLYGESRGGHIPGAVQIPYSWYFNSDKTVRDVGYMNALFLSRGITKEKDVTAYCTAGVRSGYVYFILRLMGYSQVSNYDASIAEWSADKNLPMEKARRYSIIVYPAWVKAVIDYHAPGSTTDPPPNYPYARDHKFLVFATAWGPLEKATAYLEGHVPGAIYSDSDIYENGSPRWFLLPDAEIHATMGKMGITSDTTVVVYGTGGLSARLWWILKYAGLRDVRLLNGGYKQWVADGYAGETSINYPVAATFSGSVRKKYIASTAYVAKNLDSIFVGDVRSYDEHAGAKSGYSYLQAKGRIPGAVWLCDGRIYSDSDATISSYTQVRDLWKKKGLLSKGSPNKFDREVIFYCGGGYRSALTLLYAYMMGYDNVRNYSSGWSDWSTTYAEDASCGGITPGWCQSPSPRPIEIESPSN